MVTFIECARFSLSLFLNILSALFFARRFSLETEKKTTTPFSNSSNNYKRNEKKASIFFFILLFSAKTCALSFHPAIPKKKSLPRNNIQISLVNMASGEKKIQLIHINMTKKRIHPNCIQHLFCIHKPWNDEYIITIWERVMVRIVDGDNGVRWNTIPDIYFCQANIFFFCKIVCLSFQQTNFITTKTTTGEKQAQDEMCTINRK